MKTDRFTVGKKFQYEFQWRLLSLGGALGIRGMAMENWQQATKLVSQQQVRKKNLEPGGHYEFRVRSVEDLPMGTLGDRSMWSDSLKVMLNREDFKPQTKPEVRAPEPMKAPAAAGHRHPVQHSKAQTAEPSKPRATGGPLGGAGAMPDLADYLAEEFDESDEDVEVPEKASATNVHKGLGKKKSSQWEKIDGQDPVKRTDSIFDKTFYHKVYSMNSTTAAQEVSSGEDDDDEDEEAHEVGEELDFDQSWRDEDEVWFDLHPPKYDMIKYQHEVRELPSLEGRVIGYLIPGAGVQAKRPKNFRKGGGLNAAGGYNWLFCRFHKVSRDSPPRKPVDGAPKGAQAKEWGWALINDKDPPSLGHVYLAKAAGVDEEEDGTSPLPSPSRINNFKKRAGVSFREDKAEEKEKEEEGGGDPAADKKFVYEDTPGLEEWTQYQDENGYPYYYNSVTGESRWEPPEWVEETDETSGAKYYVKLDSATAKPLHSTWSRPDMFAKLNREVEITEEEWDEYENDNFDEVDEYDEES